MPCTRSTTIQYSYSPTPTALLLDNSILFPSGTFFGTQNGAFHGTVMNAGSFSLASIFCAPRVGYGGPTGARAHTTAGYGMQYAGRVSEQKLLS